MNSPVKIWRNQKHISTLLGLEGKIITWTIVRVPPTGFSSLAPYPVAVVGLADGKRITAQMVDWSPEDLDFGKPVKLVVRKVSEPTTEGIIPYGIKAKPL